MHEKKCMETDTNSCLTELVQVSCNYPLRNAFVLRGHKGDFYFKTTLTVLNKCSVTKERLTLVF